MKNIALLGCGAIGSQIALAIDSGLIEGKLTQIYDQDKANAKRLVERLKNKPVIVENFHLLSTGPVDIVVEAASQQAVKDVALSVLQNRKDLMIMSVGALLDESILEVLSDACKEFRKIIYLPSGAIAGLDAIKSVKNELDTISITTLPIPERLSSAATLMFAGKRDTASEAVPSKIVVFCEILSNFMSDVSKNFAPFNDLGCLVVVIDIESNSFFTDLIASSPAIAPDGR